MSIPVLPTTDVKFVAGTIGLFGAAPGAAHLSEFKTFNANPEVTMTTLAGLVQKDAAKLAAVVVANLGLTGEAATAGTAYLIGEFNANPANHGKVVIDALLNLTGLTADATFGAAATAVTAMINKGAAYSAVSTNTSKDLTVLKAAIAAGAVNEGVIGVDSGKFTATNDTVTVSATTLNAGDTFVDPSTLDNDVLTLNLQGNVVNPLLGTRFINIETMAINVQGLLGTEAVGSAAGSTLGAVPLTAGSNLDFAAQTQTIGLKTINVSGDSRGSLGLLNVRDEVSRVDASLMADDQLNTDLDGIHLSFNANINANTSAIARTILGSQGNDLIFSTVGADTISGNRGDDRIDAAAGNDSVDGGAGDDSILAGAGNDTVNGGAGNDTIRTNTGADSVTAGDGNDFVEVSAGATGSAAATVLGGTGADTVSVMGATGGVNIDGQDDNDIVVFWNGTTVDATKLEGGLGGNDTMQVADSVHDTIAQNLLNASTGFETYDFSNNGTALTDVGVPALNTNQFSLASKTSSLTITAGYAVSLTSGSGNDSITGSSLNDALNGGSGNDTIGGGAGNDTITGGAGADSMTGGANNDTFVFDATADAGDRVADFTATGAADVLDFTAFLGSAANMAANSAHVNAIDANGDGDANDPAVVGPPAIAAETPASDLNLTGFNLGVITGEPDGIINATQVVTANTANNLGNEIILGDNQKAVVLVSTSAAATAPATYNVYYIQDTNANAAATTFTVTLAGVVTLADASAMASANNFA